MGPLDADPWTASNPHGCAHVQCSSESKLRRYFAHSDARPEITSRRWFCGVANLRAERLPDPASSVRSQGASCSVEPYAPIIVARTEENLKFPTEKSVK